MKEKKHFLLLYVRFSWSVGEAGGRKEVSTHTNTMVRFPCASPQDAAYIYTQHNQTHTHTQHRTIDPHTMLTAESNSQISLRVLLASAKKTWQMNESWIFNVFFFGVAYVCIFLFLVFWYFIEILKHVHMLLSKIIASVPKWSFCFAQ